MMCAWTLACLLAVYVRTLEGEKALRLLLLPRWLGAGGDVKAMVAGKEEQRQRWRHCCRGGRRCCQRRAEGPGCCAVVATTTTARAAAARRAASSSRRHGGRQGGRRGVDSFPVCVSCAGWAIDRSIDREGACVAAAVGRSNKCLLGCLSVGVTDGGGGGE